MRRMYLIPAAAFCAGFLLMFLIHLGSGQKKAPVLKEQTVSTQETKTLPPQTCVDRKYKVVPEDRERGLWGIAEKEYGGRGYLNRLVAEKSSKDYPSLVEKPGLIRVGWVLTIPCCLCDLPVLAAARLATPRPKVIRTTVKVTTTKIPCPACPVVEKPVTPSAPKPLPANVSPPEAPKPSPAPSQTQSQTVVIAPAAPQPAATPVPAPAKPQEVAPQPVPETPKPMARLVPQPPPHLLVGSAWNSFGQNPIEPGNFVDYFHVDQGYIIGNIGKFQVEPYVGFNAVKDTKGFSWDNRIQGEAGLKLVRPFSHGVIEVGGAYAAERRFLNNGLPAQTRTGAIGFTNGWFGRDQPTRHESKRKLLPGTTPGTLQWRVGNVSPFEQNNLIGVVRADQGFTLAKVKGVSLIPTGIFQLGFDTDKNPWNNRYTYGGGVKIAIPWRAGVLDFQGVYQCATQYAGVGMAGGSRCGPGFSVNIWTGWRRRGGE